MEPNKPFSTKARIKSFSFAFNGIIAFFKTEHNAWIHVVVAFIVVVAGFILKVTAAEWCFLSFAIALVIITEMFNTAIELLCDMHTKEIHPVIKKIKDISAAATLIAAIVAVVVGLFVFVPRVF